MNESPLVWGLGDDITDSSTPCLKHCPLVAIAHTVTANHKMSVCLSTGLPVNLQSTVQHTALHMSLEDTFSQSLCSSNLQLPCMIFLLFQSLEHSVYFEFYWILQAESVMPSIPYHDSIKNGIHFWSVCVTQESINEN